MDEMQSHHNHTNQASGSGGTMSDSMATTMPAMTMTMTFSSSTTVTLLFPGCTTTTPAAYAGALVLLFALSVFHRFLGAVRAQLERTAWWHSGDDDDGNDRATTTTSAEDEKKVGSTTWWRHHVRRLSGVDKRVLGNDDYDVEGGAAAEEREPLSPRPVTAGRAAVADGYGDEVKKVKAAAGFWTPSGPWRVGRDGVRSTLECGRAALGYLLSVDFFLVSPPLL